MPKTGELVQPLKWHGGKSYLADWIISLMPPRCKNPNAPAADDPGWLHYVEPYFGGGAVLLAQDPEGISEAVNDISRGLINFWQVLQNERLFERFNRRMGLTAFSEEEFSWAKKVCEMASFQPANDQGAVELAASFFVFCRQSLSGRMDSFAGITRNRTRRGMNEQVSAWLNAVDGLPAVHERLKRVLILNRPALEVIRSQDGPRTLFYLDPPYLHETRATTGEYEHEMDYADHEELLRLLATIKGRFLLSGYPSDLYKLWADLKDWKRHDFKIDNKAASGKKKRQMTECVWTNF